MPIFDYKCPNCNNKKMDVYVHKYDEVVKCKQCNVVMSKLVPTGICADTFPADGVYLEHVSAEGKTFYSKKEMKAYAKKNKLELGYLL